jgi:hypothetical protein
MAARQFEYVYSRYNPGQYPTENAHIDVMAADGWRVHTALPNYNEIYILWERAVPKVESKKAEQDDDGKASAKSKTD